MVIEPFINGSSVIIGGFAANKLPERRTGLNPLFGLCSIGLGIMAIPG